MAKNIFIAATGQNCGKTTTSIGLMHLAQKKYGRVGFIKPLGPKPVRFQRCMVDKDAALTLHGNRRDVGRIIHNVQIGAASTQRVTELLSESSLLIVTSSVMNSWSPWRIFTKFPNIARVLSVWSFPVRPPSVPSRR